MGFEEAKLEAAMDRRRKLERARALPEAHIAPCGQPRPPVVCLKIGHQRIDEVIARIGDDAFAIGIGAERLQLDFMMQPRRQLLQHAPGFRGMEFGGHHILPAPGV